MQDLFSDLINSIDDALTNETQERNIEQPSKPRRGVTCRCRAASNGLQDGNCPDDEFAFGTATAPTYSQARAEAERVARKNLGKQAKQNVRIIKEIVHSKRRGYVSKVFRYFFTKKL